MPKEGLNIYFTITDQGSPVLTSLGDKTKVLDKETQSLAQSYAALQKANEPLIRKQTELKSLIEANNKVISDARKEYKKYGDEMSETKLNMAIEVQNDLKKSLAEVEGQLKSNQKTYTEYQDAIRKSAMRNDLDDPNYGFGLISGQVGDMLSSSIGGFADSALSSALGGSTASLVSNGIGDAISGAMAGLTFGPTGALIGGIAGAASGLITGGTQVFGAKDDAFQDYYTGLYDDVSAGTDEMVESGSTVAGSREQTKKAFAKRFGSDEAAGVYLDQVEDFAALTNYDYDEITSYAKKLLNSYDKDEVFSVLQSLSDATAGLSLNSSDVDIMISGLSRMRTTGKTTQEYLNYFSERGVDVYQALSDATGADKKDIAGMVTKGQIEGGFAAQAILDYIDTTYGGLSEDLMGTYDALTDNLQDIMTSLGAAGGEGYNEMRKEGVEADIEAYSGALGDAVEEINRISGENRAYLENLSGQYQREALEAVLLGHETSIFSEEDKAKLEALRQDYAKAEKAYNAGDQEAGLDMEKARESAEALATAAYESSEQYQKLKETELEQIEAIRENTEGLAGATAAYRESQERSKGLMGNYMDDLRKNLVNTGLLPSSSPLSKDIAAMWEIEEEGSRHAYGLARVPYDDYPAGERVLTAAQARAQDRMEDPPTLQRADVHFGTNPAPVYEATPLGYAYGLNRAPHDDFPALLHEGERVLSAEQALGQDRGEDHSTILRYEDNRASSIIETREKDRKEESFVHFYRDVMPRNHQENRVHGGENHSPTSSGGTTIQVTVTGNTFTAAGEELAEQVAEVIAREVVRAEAIAVPR